MTPAALLLLIPSVLVADLGHRDFRRRETAQRALAACGPLAAPAVAAGKRSPDREIARRCERLERDGRARRVDAQLAELSRRFAPWPWLDGLDVPNRWDVVRFYLDLAHKEIPPQPPPEWGDFRVATRLWLVDQLEAGRTVEQLSRHLGVMRRSEDDWRARHRAEQLGGAVGP